MSERELGRLRVLEQVVAGKMQAGEASRVLAMSSRQLRRLRRRFEAHGAAGLVHGLRGQASNRKVAGATALQAQQLVAAHYADFGPTLAAEKLAERHGLSLSVETVRGLMIAAGLWQARRKRCTPIHPLRARRGCRGELIQIDGSLHDWFEARAPRCSLLVFIDDATSELMALRFVPAESTAAYMGVLHDYIVEHGLPACLYSDRHSIFCTNRAGQPHCAPTQFGRALAALGIEGIQASSPQAKGRVERANQTLQDRLVKELRLAGISGIEQANAWLPGFVRRHNARFKVVARQPQDAHVPFLGLSDELGRILAHHHSRRLSATLSCQFEGQILQVQAPGQQRRLAGQTVLILARLDGTVTIEREGRALAYERCARTTRVKAPVDAKTLDLRIQNVLNARPRPRPSALHPWKRWVGTTPPNRPPPT